MKLVRKAGLQVFAFMLFLLCTMETASAAPKLQVLVNNSSLNNGVQIVYGKTMVPLNAFQSFNNIVIQWNAAAKQATIVRDTTVIKLNVGQRTAWVNAKPVQLDAPAKIVNGRVTVPLRFIAEALGAKVTVDVAANKVWIQERASAAILNNYNSNDLTTSRIAALRIPYEERQLSQLSSDSEALSSTYYFPEGRSDSYFMVYGQIVTYVEIKDKIRSTVWEAKLDSSKEATSTDFTVMFGYPIAKENGKPPVLSPSYAYFYNSIWGSNIMFGIINSDGSSKIPGQSVYWSDSIKDFIMAIPGETKETNYE